MVVTLPLANQTTGTRIYQQEVLAPADTALPTDSLGACTRGQTFLYQLKIFV